MTILALVNRLHPRVVVGLCCGTSQLKAVVALPQLVNKVRKTVLKRGLHIVEIKCFIKFFRVVQKNLLDIEL